MTTLFSVKLFYALYLIQFLGLHSGIQELKKYDAAAAKSCIKFNPEWPLTLEPRWLIKQLSVNTFGQHSV